MNSINKICLLAALTIGSLGASCQQKGKLSEIKTPDSSNKVDIRTASASSAR